MLKMSFNELKEMNGKELSALIPFQQTYEEKEKGILNINGTTVFNCFHNKVGGDNDTFAFIHFFNKDSKEVANICLFNINDEKLIIEENSSIYSETILRVMNMNYKKSISK